MSIENLSLIDLADNQNVILCYMPVPSTVHIKVEPATMAAIVSAAMDYIKSKDNLKWQSDVSDALSQISAKLDLILSEIQKLRLYFDQRIKDETLFIFQSEVEARRVSAEEILAGINKNGVSLPEETKSRLIGLLDGMSVSLRQLMNWQHFNFDAYQAVLSGVLSKLFLMSITDRPIGEIKAFAKMAVNTYLQPAIDPLNPNSFEAARNSCALEAIQKKNQFDGYIGRWWWLFRHESVRPGHDPDHIPDVQIHNTFGIASGDISTPLKFNSSGELNFEVPWYPRIGNREDTRAMQRFQDDLNSQKQTVLDLLSREAALRSHIETIRKVIEILEAY
ncbi:hypothetical protein KSU19_11630 [Enterobacter quasiroggenkampii]|uniref:hypothetical protein n=1 Tax=Enterobacter quasiroggenkampii TaxID=2497436 RepID=UPI0021CF5A0D|nr:hypothetical protein [Enterobacter quasiroggenkampii]MCU6328303.1 hypothetical protein [Enterobacter quasiroggenkampii]